MSLIKGGFQRLFQTFLYILLFCCAGIIIGVYSYFLSVQADRNIPIPTWQKAVEGMSGAAVLYLVFAVVLTCCLGGISFFAFLALVLDVLFAAAMIAIAVLTRDGASSCTGNVQTPLGDGPADSNTGGFGNDGFGSGSGENLTYSASLGSICRLNTAAFAVSILAAFLFLCTAVMQVMLVRHHKKEKRYGPSPSNNYTSGYGKKRFGFGRKNKGAQKDAEMGAMGRPSHETGMTGTTVGGAGGANSYDKVDNTVPNNTYATPANTYGGHAPHGAHGGYYTAPTGTGASNPYGYQTTNQATNY